MKIGLVRHFPVRQPKLRQRWVTQEELLQWVADYDAADVEGAEVQIGEWDCCLASDLPRAAQTAAVLYKGPVTHTTDLREIPVYPLFSKNRRLPGRLWLPLLRLAWLCGHPSQRETKRDVKERIQRVLAKVAQGDNVLIVSHGALMVMLRKELRVRGFRGPRLGRPKHGALYIFER